MKTNVFLSIATILLISLSAEAQRGNRIGYIDMDYILENVTEYQEASQQLDQKVNQWKKEVEKKLDEVDAMKKQLDNERVLLTKELIAEREEEIAYEEELILDYQQKRFGPGGDLYIQKRQLVEPVQDQVFNIIQDISSKKKFDMVMRKSSDVLFVADRMDISDQVLRVINRTAKRKQLDGRKDKDEFEREESKTVEQDKETQARQQAIEAKKAEREAALEERAKEREAQREARKKEFEERRQRLLEERQRKKDSIAAARAAKRGESTGETGKSTTPPGANAAEDRAAQRAALLAERQRRKDSALAARKKRRDSILEARKRKNDNN